MLDQWSKEEEEEKENEVFFRRDIGVRSFIVEGLTVWLLKGVANFDPG